MRSIHVFLTCPFPSKTSFLSELKDSKKKSAIKAEGQDRALADESSILHQRYGRKEPAYLIAKKVNLDITVCSSCIDRGRSFLLKKNIA